MSFDDKTPAPSAVEAEPTKPAIKVNVIRYNMEAEVIVGKTSMNTLDPQVEEVLAALEAKGVVKGINERKVKDLCAFPSWEEPVTVAAGKEPETGRDGALEYLVETQRELKPRIQEDGTADYKDLGFIQAVTKDQPLCRIIPAEQGEAGWDVLGNPIEGLYGRAPQSPEGPGTYLSEDGTMLLAAVDGNVEVRRGVVRVQDVMKVPGNVDNSTGNIIFPGDVFIQGDVSSGFTVQSGGSIAVKGTVEGATLQAKGDISVSESVNGMDRGSIIAGGSIKCRYMQNCTIKCEENVYSDSIMYCDLECGGDVELSGRLIGGRTSVSGVLTAKTIGTSSHVATEVHLCVPSAAKAQEANFLEALIEQHDEDIRKLAQVMARFEDLAKQGKLGEEHRESLVQVRESYMAISTARKQAAAQLEETRRELLLASAEHSFVRCKDRCHSGVRLSFGPLNMVVQASFVRSRIGVIVEKIVISPLT